MRNNITIADGVYRFQAKGSGAFAGQSTRMGYDLETPGRLAEDIEVNINQTTGVVEVIAHVTPRPPYDLEGMVDKFGFNKVKTKLTFNLPFDADKYDLDNVKVTVSAGVTRVFAVTKALSDKLCFVDGKWILTEPDVITSVLARDL